VGLHRLLPINLVKEGQDPDELGRDRIVGSRGGHQPASGRPASSESDSQRYGDSPGGNRGGLGLAVARGFTEATGGALRAEDTPGGGLTMVLAVPTAPARRPEEPDLPATAAH
jgi:hypothetical protein